ncbi:MAG: exodeoxyribonuclease V subunit alpha [Planctomycetaceae bacterium]
MNHPPSLHDSRAAGAIGRDDITAAALLVEMARRDGAAEPDSLAWLGMCLALRTVRDGHTCVDLDQIAAWAGEIDLAAGDHPAWPTAAEPWVAALSAAAALVGGPGERTPFILDGHRLYLARSHAEEASIAASIRTRAAAGTIRILLGGPGTGKTTKVAQDLVQRFQALGAAGGELAVALAAPTGKAAARMAEALQQACGGAAVAASAEARDRILQLKPTTVHKLLGFNPRRGHRFEYRAGNPLPHDLVIVDEASMLSSSMMHHVLAALRPDAEIMLVGDPDQLASVDAGTALGDIAGFADDAHRGTPLHGCIDTLTKIHRAEAVEILDLGRAIRQGNREAALAILGAGGGPVAWIDPADRSGLEALTADVVGHARGLRRKAHGTDARAVLVEQARLQVLCAHREGSMGVAGWNARIERQLDIPPGFPWYTGRPVMVTRNSPSLRLANGDVGVVMSDGPTRKAVFGILDASGRPLELPVSRLEDIDTVHALTIHKSQGSEYEHVVVVLPERTSRIVTRELLYTGVTRARKRVTVVGSREVIEAAIQTPIRRATGLAQRLA